MKPKSEMTLVEYSEELNIRIRELKDALLDAFHTFLIKLRGV